MTINKEEKDIQKKFAKMLFSYYTVTPKSCCLNKNLLFKKVLIHLFCVSM